MATVANHTAVAVPLTGQQMRADFQQNPLGRLGDRNVQVANAGAPRHGGGTVKERLTRWAERKLNALTPNGMRADSKAQQALRLTGARVGDLLGALSRPGAGHAQAVAEQAALMGRIEQGLGPLAGQRDRLLPARIDVHCANLPSPALAEVHRGAVEALALHAPGSPTHAMLSDVVSIAREQLDERDARALAPAFAGMTQALALEAQHAGAVVDAYQGVMSQARQMIDARGGDLNFAERESAAAALVNGAIAHAVDHELIGLGEAGQIVNLLPTEDLRAMSTASSQSHGAHAAEAEGLRVSAGLRLVQGAIGLRAERLSANLDGQMGALVKSMDEGGTTVVADALAQAATTLNQLQRHENLHGMQSDRTTVGHASDLAKLWNLLMHPGGDLSEVSDQTLGQLARLGKALGLPTADPIDRAIAARKQQGLDAFAAAMRPLAQAAAGGDIQALVANSAPMRAHADAVMQRYEALGAKFDGADGKAAFQALLFDHTAAGLNQTELSGLFHHLNSPATKALQGALVEAAYDQFSRSNGDEMLGKAMFNTGIDVDMLKLAATDALNTRYGVLLPELPDTQEYGARDLGEAGRVALRSVFNIEPGTDGVFNLKAGVLAPRAQTAFDANVATLKHEKTHTEAGRDFGVADAFWRDLNRADFMLARSPGDQPEALFDRVQGGDREHSVQTLDAALGHNPVLLRAVTSVANQNLWAGAEMVLASPDSSIRLPDGTPGAMRPARDTQNRVSYTITPDGHGGAVVSSRYAVDAAGQFVAAGDPSNMRRLDQRDSRMVFTCDVHIDAQGNATVPDGVGFIYDLKEDAWSAPFDRPMSLDALLRGSDTEAKAAFSEHLKFGAGTENFAFLEALATLEHAPTLDSARALFVKFVQPDESGVSVGLGFDDNARPGDDMGDVKVNVSSALTQDLRAALYGDQPLTADGLREAFRPARDEITKLLKDNRAFETFVAKYGENA